MSDTDWTIGFDPKKRDWTLRERGLDFADAADIFRSANYRFGNDRYGETRFVTIGTLRDRMMVIVWTPRGDIRHIISMRKANEREQRKYAQYLD